MRKATIRSLFKGELSKQDFMKLYIPAVILLVLAWAFARFTFSQLTNYQVESNFISNQGNVFKNPIGAWFFIASTAYMGLVLFFYFIFLYHHLKPSINPLSHIMLISGCLGGIGLMGVGIFPENYSPLIGELHNKSAVMAFSGLGLGALCSLVILAIKAYRKHNFPDPYHLAIVMVVLSFFIMMLIPTHEDTIRQWTGFYIIFTWANVTLLVIPEKVLATDAQ